MESKATKKKWVKLLLTATMSVVLLFGATACNSDNNIDPNVVPGANDSVIESPSASPSAS